MTNTKLVRFNQLLTESFNDEELRDLCFQLNFVYENLEGNAKNAKIRSLITYFERRGDLTRLQSKVKQSRPNIRWPNLSFNNTDDIPKALISEESVKLTIDRVRPFSKRKSGRQIAYGTVNLADNAIAYGEGLNLVLTLENLSDEDIVVPTVDVLIEDFDAYPIDVINYSSFEVPATHLELPGTSISEPIRLTELNYIDDLIPVTEGRLFLRKGKDLESQHTLSFEVVAFASGLWNIRIQAKFMQVGTTNFLLTESDLISIVKR